MDLQILDIDLKITYPDFESSLREAVDNHSEPMNYDIKQMSTRMGKKMYKITVDNDNGSDISIVAEQNDITGDVIFYPMKMQSFHNSFYTTIYYDFDSVHGTDEDPTLFLVNTLRDMCIKNKGSIAFIDYNGVGFITKNGNRKNVASIALIDTENNVYSSSSAKTVKGESEDSNFSVNKPIGEWLNEHSDVQTAIGSLSLDQKMNYIGKYLIKQRLAEDIDADEFMDIFRQAGIFGFSDSSVLNIYKLIM